MSSGIPLFQNHEIHEKHESAFVIDLRLMLDIKTRYGHHRVMKKAMVSELKARLSAYLAEVKQGGTVIVCERQTAIARLVPYEDEDRDFRVREAAQPISRLGKIHPVRLGRNVNLDTMLREMRGDR
jgi:prevent-host-death family protein